MSEAVPLHEMLTNCVNDFLASNGGGIADGFVYAVRYCDSQGKPITEMGCMDGQSTLLSAGLTKYLQVVTDAWVQDELFGIDEEID